MKHQVRTKASRQDDDRIDAPESSYLYIATSQLPNSGNGLFTVTNIYKDEVICLYKGKILTNDQANVIADKGEDKYFIALLDGSIMDSMYVKCFAKYANDAEGLGKSKFRNNSKIAIDDNGDVCLVATRNLKAGEEVFCSYGRRYWKKHGAIVKSSAKHATKKLAKKAAKKKK